MPAPPGYDALHQSAAWLDLPDRGKIKMLGEDRVRLLHAMTTNNIQQLTPGSGCYAYFLNAQGRILADVNVLCCPDDLLLDTEPETREKILKHLDQFIIADDVTLEDDTPTLTSLAVEGPEAAKILQAWGAPAPANAYATETWDQVLIARLTYSGSEGFRLIAPTAMTGVLKEKLTAAGAVPGTVDAFEIVRIEQGKPRYGIDLSERFLAQEANQPHALNFSKGCYLGQEIVERVRSRGQVHRVLVPLELNTHQAPEPGTKLKEGEASVAEITSAVFSPKLGKVVALAYVRTDRSAPGTELKVADFEVRVRPARQV